MDDAARAELTAALYRIAGGDRAALKFLYERTGAKLFGLCQRILGESAAAEDVLQEVFLIIWHKAGQFDASHGTSPITWLAAIARNRALDSLRAGKRRFEDIDAAAEIQDARPGAEAMLEMAERDASLNACLSGLEPRAQNAIRAAFFGGQTYDSLARQAGTKLATMKSLIRRGLLQLRACLSHG
jgi:RNA polymerase sigma-70 factor (ECF subfamily)